MPSIKVKRKVIWDAWQFTADSTQEIVDLLNAETSVSDVNVSTDSISFKHYQSVKTLRLNDWILKEQSFIVVIDNNTFVEKWEQV